MKNRINKTAGCSVALFLAILWLTTTYYLNNDPNSDGGETQPNKSLGSNAKESECVITGNDEWRGVDVEEHQIKFSYPNDLLSRDAKIVTVGEFTFLAATNSMLYNQLDYFQSDDINAVSNARLLNTVDASKTYWFLWTPDVEEPKDLNRVVKKWFGGGCKYSGVSTTTNPNIFDVLVEPEVLGSGEDPHGPDSSCFVNWRFIFKYSQTAQKAVLWDWGQETLYLTSEDQRRECSVDKIVANSIRFVESGE